MRSRDFNTRRHGIVAAGLQIAAMAWVGSTLAADAADGADTMTNNIGSLFTIAVISASVPLVVGLLRLKIAEVVLLLGLGVVFGPQGLDMITINNTTETFNELGLGLLFFLAGVEETANRARTQTVALVALREELRNRMRNNAKATQLVDLLFLNPYVSIQGVTKLLDIADPTARRLVRDLEAEGILTEASGRRWRRHYRSDPIAKILLAGIGQER